MPHHGKGRMQQGRARRQAEAKIQNEERAKRTPEQQVEQVERLDKLLGKGRGAVKERARLRPAKTAAPAPTKPDPTQPKPFIIRVNDVDITVKSLSQIRRLSALHSFNPEVPIKEFRKHIALIAKEAV
jgi:hypothetical protein